MDDIPKDLIADYRDWAGPASRQRLGKMRGHLKMLAAMRRDRPGFEVAVRLELEGSGLVWERLANGSRTIADLLDPNADL